MAFRTPETLAKHHLLREFAVNNRHLFPLQARIIESDQKSSVLDNHRIEPGTLLVLHGWTRQPKILATAGPRRFAVPLSYQGEFRVLPRTFNATAGLEYSFQKGERLRVVSVVPGARGDAVVPLQEGDLIQAMGESISDGHEVSYVGCERYEDETGRTSKVYLPTNCGVTFEEVVLNLPYSNSTSGLFTVRDFVTAVAEQSFNVELVASGPDHASPDRDLPIGTPINLRKHVVEPAIYASLNAASEPSFHIPMRTLLYVRFQRQLPRGCSPLLTKQSAKLSTLDRCVEHLTPEVFNEIIINHKYFLELFQGFAKGQTLPASKNTKSRGLDFRDNSSVRRGPPSVAGSEIISSKSKWNKFSLKLKRRSTSGSVRSSGSDLGSVVSLPINYGKSRSQKLQMAKKRELWYQQNSPHSNHVVALRASPDGSLEDIRRSYSGREKRSEPSNHRSNNSSSTNRDQSLKASSSNRLQVTRIEVENDVGVSAKLASGRGLANQTIPENGELDFTANRNVAKDVGGGSIPINQSSDGSHYDQVRPLSIARTNQNGENSRNIQSNEPVQKLSTNEKHLQISTEDHKYEVLASATRSPPLPPPSHDVIVTNGKNVINASSSLSSVPLPPLLSNGIQQQNSITSNVSTMSNNNNVSNNDNFNNSGNYNNNAPSVAINGGGTAAGNGILKSNNAPPHENRDATSLQFPPTFHIPPGFALISLQPQQQLSGNESASPISPPVIPPGFAIVPTTSGLQSPITPMMSPTTPMSPITPMSQTTPMSPRNPISNIQQPQPSNNEYPASARQVKLSDTQDNDSYDDDDDDDAETIANVTLHYRTNGKMPIGLPVPADGNLYSFSVKRLCDFLSGLNLDEEVVKGCKKHRIDGKKFSRMNDQELEKRGLLQPIVMYFRKHTIRKTNNFIY